MLKKMLVTTLALTGLMTLTNTGAMASSDGPNYSDVGGSGAAVYPGSSVSVRPGDILVTDSVSSNGFTGHAGIVVDYSGNVVSIAGYGYYPKKTSISTWFGSYPDEKVVRLNDTASAQSAANWASSFVINHSDVPYGMSDIGDPYDETYCSKIVWDAYQFGANVTLPFYYDMFFAYNLVAPYSLLDAPNSNIVFSNADF
ncbi:MAG TPA: YiiX/YebB-like N1pC/P60 family cysteine hydrolase [Bacilli bacterium]|nr:YiiX/YebB-like N1pC/P60 family cysteine hydrolase [Bacilli bacterium]